MLNWIAVSLQLYKIFKLMRVAHSVHDCTNSFAAPRLQHNVKVRTNVLTWRFSIDNRRHGSMRARINNINKKLKRTRNSAVAERPRDAPLCWKSCCHSRSLKVIRNYTSKFLLVFHCNYVSILYRFWDIQHRIMLVKVARSLEITPFDRSLSIPL